MVHFLFCKCITARQRMVGFPPPPTRILNEKFVSSIIDVYIRQQHRKSWIYTDNMVYILFAIHGIRTRVPRPWSKSAYDLDRSAMGPASIHVLCHKKNFLIQFYQFLPHGRTEPGPGLSLNVCLEVFCLALLSQSVKWAGIKFALNKLI